jgi:hypothetical protein
MTLTLYCTYCSLSGPLRRHMTWDLGNVFPSIFHFKLSNCKDHYCTSFQFKNSLTLSPLPTLVKYRFSCTVERDSFAVHSPFAWRFHEMGKCICQAIVTELGSLATPADHYARVAYSTAEIRVNSSDHSDRAGAAGSCGASTRPPSRPALGLSISLCSYYSTRAHPVVSALFFA